MRTGIGILGNVGRAARHVGLVAGVVLAATTLTGCLVASQHRVDVTGREVSKAEFDSIKAGVTSEREVLEMFGPATSTTPMSDGGVMHTWTATKREEKEGAVFLIFASSTEKTTRQSLNVTCKDGLVTAVSMK